MCRKILSTSSSLCHAGLLSWGMLYASLAMANPQIEAVTKGNAHITESGKKLNIHQQSDKAVIDWRSFDIEVDEHTQFYQPNAHSMTLNRVNSNDPSRILGKLTANGNLVLVNPNGVFFGSNATVDVNSIIATTSDIDNADFMNGKLIFDKPGNPNAAIINQGTITAKEAGLVGLVAPNVINHGVITAKLGRVELASGDGFFIDLYGDGLYQLKVSDAVAAQLIQNTGTLDAAGGTIAITAAAAGEIVNSLVHIEGELHAPTIEQQGGVIRIMAEGSNAVTGNQANLKGKKQGNSNVTIQNATLNASGTENGEQGGQIEILGDRVIIGHNTLMDASGYEAVMSHQHSYGGTANLTSNQSIRQEEDFLAHENRAGGSIKIGGDYLGGGDTSTAKSVSIAENVQIRNDATHSDDAGRTIIWSDQRTDFHGTIQSTSMNGNGGFVETSSYGILNSSGLVYAAKWLLDPNNITIQDAGSDTNVGASPNFTSTNDSAIVTTASIETALNAGTDVVIQTSTAGTNGQDGNITLNDPIDKTAGGDATLTLQAHNSIILNDPITSTSGALSITLDADSDDSGAGDIQLTNANMTTLGGDIIMYGDGGDINLTGISINSQGGDITFRTGDNGTITINQDINAGSGDLTINADNHIFNNTLDGTGNLDINNNTRFRAMYLGDGASAGNQISSTSLNNISSNWNLVTFNSSDGHLDIESNSWNTNTSFIAKLGYLTVLGTQNSGSNNLGFGGRRNFNANAPLIGSGTLTFFTNGSTSESLYIGDDAAGGGFRISDSDIAQIQDGWSEIIFDTQGNTGSRLEIDTAGTSLTFYDPVRFSHQRAFILHDNLIGATGSDASFTFDGELNTNSDFTLNGTVSSPAPIVFETIGALNLNNNISTTNQNITFNNDITTITVQSDISINSGTASITVGSSGIGAGANNVTLQANSMIINNNVVTTGDIILLPGTNTSSIGISGGSGDLLIDDALLGRFTIGNQLVIGHASTGTGGVDIDNWDCSSCSYDVSVYGGAININGATLGSGDFTASSQNSSNIIVSSAINNTGMTGSITLLSSSDIILNQDIATTSATANALVLSAIDDFTNNAGSDALSATNSRWLVYSDELADNSIGGLTATASDYNKTYASDAPGTIAAGNRYIYAGAVPPAPPSGGGSSGSSGSRPVVEEDSVEVEIEETTPDIPITPPVEPETPVVEEDSISQITLPTSVEKIINGSDRDLREKTDFSSPRKRSSQDLLAIQSNPQTSPLKENNKGYASGIDHVFYLENPENESSDTYEAVLIKDNNSDPSNPTIQIRRYKKEDEEE